MQAGRRPIVRILIVKLSSLGDVVHAMPVVQDIRSARPGAIVDWVVEPAFAPLLQRMGGLAEVIACPLRRWRRAWWTGAVRREVSDFRARLQRERYDAVLDLQGLTKSAVVAWLAHGPSYGLANRTDGAGHEWTARWLVDHPLHVAPRIHALDRSRELAARALDYQALGPPVFGLGRAAAAAPGARAPGPSAAAPTLLLIHGSSRDDKLWPEADWIRLGRRALEAGWGIALPQAGPAELRRAQRIAAALDTAAAELAVGREAPPRVTVWPALDLGGVIGRMQSVQGAIGVDSGLSHIATALGLPHVQLYNFPTAWRTGPQLAHGHRQQVSVEGDPVPALDAVWQAWQQVRPPPVALPPGPMPQGQPQTLASAAVCAAPRSNAPDPGS